MKIQAISQAMADAPTAHSELSRNLRRLWRQVLGMTRRAPRRLRLCENLPLGERRFVAVVEYENARFLLGGTSTALVLLARLGEFGSCPTSECAADTETREEL